MRLPETDDAAIGSAHRQSLFSLIVCDLLFIGIGGKQWFAQ